MRTLSATVGALLAFGAPSLANAQSRTFCVEGARYTCFGVELLTASIPSGTDVTVRIRNLQGATLPNVPAQVDWSRIYSIDLVAPAATFTGGFVTSADPIVVADSFVVEKGDSRETWFAFNIGGDTATTVGFGLETPYTENGAEIVGCGLPPVIDYPYFQTCDPAQAKMVEFRFSTDGQWQAQDVGIIIGVADPYAADMSCLIPGLLYDDVDAYHCLELTASTGNSATTTTLSSTPDPSNFGQSVMFTATVTRTSDASVVATGTFNFIEGGTCASPTATLASGAALNGSGQATFSNSALVAGSHTVRACYSGATGFDQSDGSDSHLVNAALVIPSTTPQVSAGGHHTCALKSDGALVCWGNNSFGQTTVPGGLASVALASTGFYHTCALKTDGTPVCWGRTTFGEGTVGGLASVAQVSAGSVHTCLLETVRTVVCLGENNEGQTTVPSGLAAEQISAGYQHTCALRTDGTPVCWGNNGFGQATVPGGLASVAQVSAGGYHTCALRTDATVVCWGNNAQGQAAVPGGLALVAQVSAGYQYTCVLKTDGTVVCWGYNSDGQATVPGGLTSVAQVSSGLYHTCAFKTDGTVACWGKNDNGQATVPSGLNLTNVVQSIAFTSAPPSPALTGGTYAVAATGGASGNAVTFSSLTASACTITGSSVSLVAVGSCTLAADQAAGNGYDAAPQQTQVFSIGSSAQAIAFTSTAPSPAFTGGAYTVAATGGASGNAVTFSSLTASICTVSGSSVSLIAVGSCTVVADQAAGNGYAAADQAIQTFVVNSPDQVIAFTSTPPNPGLVGSAYTISATGGTSGNPVTFSSLTSATCSASGNVVSFLQIGTCTIAADQAGGGGFNAAPQVSQSITVMATQTVVFTSTPPNPALAGNSYNVAATGGGSGNPIVFSSKTTAVCSVIGRAVKLLAAGSCVIAANQAAGNGYVAAPEVTQTFNVFTAQVINFTSRPPNKATVGGTYMITATGGASGNPVVFSTLTPSVCSINGSTTQFLASGTCTVAANQSGTATYAPASEATQIVKIR